MLNSKQRAYLRKLANGIDPAMIIGKGGTTDVMVREIATVLEARELVKIKILNNSVVDAKEVSQEIAEQIGADVVQVIGSKFVLYKESQEKPPVIILP